MTSSYEIKRCKSCKHFIAYYVANEGNVVTCSKQKDAYYNIDKLPINKVIEEMRANCVQKEN